MALLQVKKQSMKFFGGIKDGLTKGKQEDDGEVMQAGEGSRALSAVAGACTGAAEKLVPRNPRSWCQRNPYPPPAKEKRNSTTGLFTGFGRRFSTGASPGLHQP